MKGLDELERVALERAASTDVIESIWTAEYEAACNRLLARGLTYVDALDTHWATPLGRLILRAVTAGGA